MSELDLSQITTRAEADAALAERIDDPALRAFFLQSLDMRDFDEVLGFSAERREIRVQTGISWREILEYIDPYDLSPQIMQSYANFTVGGALSVNAHGRYVGQGPLVLGVRSLRLVLADGQVVDASPTHNAELFYGAIGGYGGLGVIGGGVATVLREFAVWHRARD